MTRTPAGREDSAPAEAPAPSSALPASGDSSSQPGKEPGSDRRTVLRVLAGGAVVLSAQPQQLLAWASRLHGSGELADGSSLQRLSAAQAESLAVLVDRILPETDTPGARAAGVHRFIDRMLAGWFEERAAKKFEKGLAKIERRSRRLHHEALVDLRPEQVDGLLAASAASAVAKRAGRFSSSRSNLHRQQFFDVLKWLTLVGYYTSEPGMREELEYRTLPGTYDPCVDVATVVRGG